METDAYTELLDYLEPGEVVEAIVFGDWGWGGYGEPEPNPVPADVRGKILTLLSAEPYLQGWRFYGVHGTPECYATYIWTNKRVIWVTQYAGATKLDSEPRNPEPVIPDMPGG